MAIENHVLLNGQIKALRKIKDGNEVVQAVISLHVIRRPNAKMGNRAGDLREDDILVMIREKKLIDYIEEKRTAVGDLLEVAGVFCTMHAVKKFHCKHCEQENSYIGSTSFVRPLCLRVDELHPKRFETVKLTEEERMGTKEEIRKVLNQKKTCAGEIIGIKDLGCNDGSMTDIQLTVREKISDRDVKEWLQWMGEVSNRIYIMGNLCANPNYNPIENGGRVCTYQLGVNRQVFIKEDDPMARADYPWIKSLGDQADSDRDALMEGSSVFIDGSIQAREGFIIEKECQHCGEICRIKGQAMEIVPYHVEYLRNCNLTKETDDGDEDDFFSEGTGLGGGE